MSFYYAVRRGRKSGIYGTCITMECCLQRGTVDERPTVIVAHAPFGRKTGWRECSEQVYKYPKASYKKFSSRSEAESFIRGGSASCKSNYKANYHSLPHPSSTSHPFSGRESYKETPGAHYSWTQSSGHTSGYPQVHFKPLSTEQGKGTPVNSSSTDRSYPSRTLSTDGQDDKFSRDAPCTSYCPIVYSDGSCIGNGVRTARAGVGVYWGAGSCYNVSERLCGSQTNQRAELVSACRALETALEQNYREVELRTDSTYTIKAMTEWMPKWIQNGWKTYGGQDVKNKEDLIRLNQLCQKVKVHWVHVPAHKGILGNEEADKLAKAGSQK